MSVDTGKIRRNSCLNVFWRQRSRERMPHFRPHSSASLLIFCRRRACRRLPLAAPNQQPLSKVLMFVEENLSLPILFSPSDQKIRAQTVWAAGSRTAEEWEFVHEFPVRVTFCRRQRSFINPSPDATCVFPPERQLKHPLKWQRCLCRHFFPFTSRDESVRSSQAARASESSLQTRHKLSPCKVSLCPTV